MWHEARRREKATQKLFIDHRKRAEKRREENRIDPSSLLQVHGIKSKIHLDLNTHKQADKSLVIWQGDQKTTIDRFDVRATLSSLPAEDRSSAASKSVRSTVVDADESEPMRKLLNFERYRLLIQNDLNKVPEQTRLNLVGKSEFLSEAKMKKLENNWFGTSGETSSTTATQPQVSNRHSQSQQPRSQGVTIGFNYNQVPPPPSNLLGLNNEIPTDDSVLKSVIDLDDYGKIELDSVDKSARGSKRTDEVASKYGLSCDEFHLLIESDANPTNLKDMVHKLQRLKDKRTRASAQGEERAIAVDPTFYGPALPPEMVEGNSSPSSLTSSCSDSPVQQRSPSGASIPLRSTRDDNLEQVAPNVEEKSSRIAPIVRARVPETLPREINGNDTVDARPVAKNGRLEAPLDEPDHQVTVPDDQGRRTRRASTPLAYKRYRRSSRSLSRELQSVGRQGRTHRRRSSSSRSSASQSSSSGSNSESHSSRTTSCSYSRSSDRSRSRSPRPSYRRQRRESQRRSGHRNNERSARRRRPGRRRRRRGRRR